MLNIREFKEADRPYLQQIFLQVRQGHFTWLDTSTYYLGSFDTATAGEHILVAHVGNTIAGFISLWLPDNFIHHLYIDNHYQGQGIGTQLLNTARTCLQTPIGLKCLEKNTTAIDFYKHYGFTEKERGESGEGAYIFFEYT
jgi:ribosomal protein S18 acetylase RimI-like enzyme